MISFRITFLNFHVFTRELDKTMSDAVSHLDPRLGQVNVDKFSIGSSGICVHVHIVHV